MNGVQKMARQLANRKESENRANEANEATGPFVRDEKLFTAPAA